MYVVTQMLALTCPRCQQLMFTLGSGESPIALEAAGRVIVPESTVLPVLEIV